LVLLTYLYFEKRDYITRMRSVRGFLQERFDDFRKLWYVQGGPWMT